MEYISLKEFIKQPKKVQKIFIEWWKPAIGDLFVWNYLDGKENDLHKLQCCTSELVINLTKSNKGAEEGERIPLLTEGQLIKFIEDKTKKKITIIEFDYDHWNIVSKFGFTYITDKADLLQAYWKLACEIAKESIKE